MQRADQIEHAEGGAKRDWFAPIVADAEAGFGGQLNCYELMKSMIEAGAAGVHFEDQLASEKKCGHLGGKVDMTAVVVFVSCCVEDISPKLLSTSRDFNLLSIYYCIDLNVHHPSAKTHKWLPTHFIHFIMAFLRFIVAF